jgi:formiminotetrahydrofolate cyclodeaminase
MAANLTLGNKKHAQSAKGLSQAAGEAERLRRELARLAKEDAEAFRRFLKARKLPQATKDEAESRARRREEALDGAIFVPLCVMEAAAESVRLLESLEGMAAPGLASDLGVGALFCRAALLGADLNVKTNAKFLPDREKAQVLAQKAESMKDFAQRAEALYRRSLARAG